MTNISISALKSKIRPMDVRENLQYAFHDFSDADIQELINDILDKWQEVGINYLDSIEGQIYFNDHMLGIIAENMDDVYFESYMIENLNNLRDIKEALDSIINDDIVRAAITVIGEAAKELYGNDPYYEPSFFYDFDK